MSRTEATKIKHKEYYEKTKDTPEHKARQSTSIENYRKEHPDWLEIHNENRRVWARKFPEKSLLKSAKERAGRRDCEFDIDESDIVIPELCPIMLIPLIKGEGKKTNNSPTLDRIDNDKGYIKGNVRVISSKANSVKSDLSISEVERMLSYMKGEI